MKKIQFCNSYGRIHEIMSIPPDDDWFQLLGSQWPCCDNLHHYTDWLREVLVGSTVEQRMRMMATPEREAHARLADEFVVYRGAYSDNAIGLSWSLREDVARKFPTLMRYSRPRAPAYLLIAAYVRRDECVLKLDRTEEEVIAWNPHWISAEMCIDPERSDETLTPRAKGLCNPVVALKRWRLAGLLEANVAARALETGR